MSSNVLIMGKDVNNNSKYVRVSQEGKLLIDASGLTIQSDISGQTVNIGSMPPITVDVSGLATEETLLATYTLLEDNFTVNGLKVDISGQTVIATGVDISGQRVDISGQSILATGVDISGQTVLVNNNLNVNNLYSNSTVYDLTNDSSTITGGDTRFEADRTRVNSWSFQNSKSQAGSNCFFYSNSNSSPLGEQAFDILYQDLQSLYIVVSINKSGDANNYPFIAAYSPSESSFFTSRWVFTIDGSAKVLSTQRVLLYYGLNPSNLFTNIPHLPLVLNNVASLGPREPNETIYLLSVNTASAQPSGDIYYNLWNSGFVLNDGIHNDYEFTSGIKSKGDLNLSKLTIENNLLGVNVPNSISVTDTSFQTIDFDSCLNTAVKNTVKVDAGLTFNNIDNMYTKGLNVICRKPYTASITTYSETDISNNNLPMIDLRAYNSLSFFGSSSHTGPGSHNILVLFSTDDVTYYTSSYTIPTNASGNFAWDFKDFCVPYIKFQFQVTITSLTAFVCLK